MLVDVIDIEVSRGRILSGLSVVPSLHKSLQSEQSLPILRKSQLPLILQTVYQSPAQAHKGQPILDCFFLLRLPVVFERNDCVNLAYSALEAA